jgi:hypothetical protein
VFHHGDRRVVRARWWCGLRLGVAAADPHGFTVGSSALSTVSARSVPHLS